MKMTHNPNPALRLEHSVDLFFFSNCEKTAYPSAYIYHTSISPKQRYGRASIRHVLLPNPTAATNTPTMARKHDARKGTPAFRPSPRPLCKRIHGEMRADSELPPFYMTIDVSVLVAVFMRHLPAIMRAPRGSGANYAGRGSPGMSRACHKESERCDDGPPLSRSGYERRRRGARRNVPPGTLG